MCGIVAAVAQRDVTPILLEGLRRLEYRGYDSAGIALSSEQGTFNRIRQLGKVNKLAERAKTEQAFGMIGIAHTRWATHGQPNEQNAHPHSSNDSVMVVHNGIIENHEVLRKELTEAGYLFTSETDTEAVVHLIAFYLKTSESLLKAVQKTLVRLKGAYSLAVISKDDPNHIIAARSGSPLVIGIGIGEHFLASDQLALLPVTHRFQFLEEGDVADITKDKVTVYDTHGTIVERSVVDSDLDHEAGDKGSYRHFMLKEIHEQPDAITSTLEGRITQTRILSEAFGYNAESILKDIDIIQIVACGTSYHSAMVARYWFEDFGLPCRVEIASEFRYRKAFLPKKCLFVTLSQSGETADTLSALRLAKQQGYAKTLAICNVPGSSLVRESDLSFMTRAGVEIGVASTKAFTTQLTALLMLVTLLSRLKGTINEVQERNIVQELHTLPNAVASAVTLGHEIKALSADFAQKHHSLFLGRGPLYPIAMEGALKLKEISYIHAEAYAAGELKHGPLALIDTEMPVIVVAPNDALLEKLKSNIEEVKTRGGQLYVFADSDANLSKGNNVEIIPVSPVHSIVAPIVYAVPLQLLAYEVAVIKGTDIDQPRNLAKSVTVE